jgi:hypothetical protein
MPLAEPDNVVSKSMNVHLQSLSDIAAVFASLRQFGRTKCDVPITRKPQVADPELGLALLMKEGNGDDGHEGADRPSCLQCDKVDPIKTVVANGR